MRETHRTPEFENELIDFDVLRPPKSFVFLKGKMYEKNILKLKKKRIAGKQIFRVFVCIGIAYGLN